jgi:hypothetical protein
MKIQDHVACMTHGRPSDDVPKEWYNAAILCDENRITNKAILERFEPFQGISELWHHISKAAGEARELCTTNFVLCPIDHKRLKPSMAKGYDFSHMLSLWTIWIPTARLPETFRHPLYGSR